MTRSIHSCLALLLSCLSLPALAQEAACEVAALIGQAQSGDKPLKVGSTVGAGSDVTTQANSRVRLKCRDGSSLVLAANSRLRIEAFEMDGTRRIEARLNLQLGLIGQKVSSGGGWTVRTPSAVTAVRGTEFAVEVGADQATGVLMQSGNVEVRPAVAQSRSIAAMLPLVALAGTLGTDCRDGKCTAAAPWGEARVKAMLDKLSGV